ncbi:MAG: (2Fe-2S)-binding protein [Pseudomonadota bacterium]
MLNLRLSAHLWKTFSPRRMGRLAGSADCHCDIRVIDNHSQFLQMVLMIICVCRNLNEKKVREAVSAGARSPKEVQAHHGCKFNCGQCRCAMGEVIADTLDDAPVGGQLLAAE